MENKKFGNFIKIIRSQKKVSDEEILGSSESLTFIKLKPVSKKNLPILVKDLEKLSQKLNEAVGVIIRKGSGPDLNEEYEDLLMQIRGKQDRLNYLSSYLETTKEKIEAAKETIEEYDEKIKEAELKKQRIKENVKKVRDSWRKRQSNEDESFKKAAKRIKTWKPWDIKRVSFLKNSNNGDIELHLEPIERVNNNQINIDENSSQNTSLQEEREELEGDEDWLDDEFNDLIDIE